MPSRPADPAPTPGDPEIPSRQRHRAILVLAVPAIGTLVADPLLGAVDTAVAGRISSAALGALGLSVAVLGAVTWIFNFLVYGTTASVARAIGAGDRRGAGERVAHAAVVAGGLGIAAGVVLWILAPLVVRWFGAVDELIDPAVAYLRVRAVGVPFVLLGYVGHGAFRGVSNTRTPLIVVGVSNALNAALDVVLVFGLGQGLAGVAWATVGAEVAAVVMFVGLLSRAGLTLTGHGLPSRQRLRSLVVVSRDLFLRTGALLAGLLAVSAAAARIDATTAAAHQVLWQVWILMSYLMDGFAIAAQAQIGTALGAGDRKAARQSARDLLVWGVGGGIVVAAVLLPLRGPLAGIFTDDPAVVAATAGAWWLAMGGHLHNGVVWVLDGVMMGASDYAYLRNSVLAAAVVAGVTGQLVATFGGGLLGLWVAVELLMLVRGAALVWRVRGDAWLTAGDELEIVAAD